jgi:glycosyltransferase involved in cell wall biosynthesis
VRLLQLTVALGYPTVLSLHDFFFPCHRIQLIDADDRWCAGPERGERCVPCLREFATPEEVRRRFRYMEQVLRGPDVVITPSVFLEQKIRGYFPFLEERLRAVPLGMKQVPRVVRERPAGAPLRILYVGVLLPHKGAHVLIEALKGLPPDAVQVSLYGTTVPGRESYAARVRAEAHGLPVWFHEAYPHDQLVSILSQHDVLVMPMIWEETFSLLAREALMAGLAVIAARRGALPEVIQDGVSGLLFEPGNAADLRRCLTRLLAEPGLLEQLRVVKPAVKTMDQYAEDIEQVYREICAEGYRVGALRQRVTAQYQACVALQQSTQRLQAELGALQVQHLTTQDQRNNLSENKARVEQEREAALVTARELENLLNVREGQLRESWTRLEAIYVSTTWKLYQGYATFRCFLRQTLNAWWKSLCASRR